MATVGVLCARGRVEEKALMAALAHAGIVSALFPPADEPLPVGPLPVAPEGRAFPAPQIVVDRHPNRQIARAVLSTCQRLAVPALSAGVAATGDRLDVASALAAHGLPRPVTALCTSEDAALAAVTAMGLPATLLPLDLQSAGVAIHDVDTAEAVLEHRSVLGGANGALGIIQAGVPCPDRLVSVLVIDGVASALTVAPATTVPDVALRLAEDAARVLHAELIAVVIALGAEGAIVWDTQPVPEFRHALSLCEITVAEVIAHAVARRLDGPTLPDRHDERHAAWLTLAQERMLSDVVVRA
jgi:[lysine-biosynthesis-protein LysW]--L-2-aminoadipate ligase